MPRRVIALVFLLIVGACSTDESDSTIDTLDAAPSTTTSSTTTTTVEPSAPSPDLVTTALREGSISQFDADILTALAFAGADLPEEFTVPVGEATGRPTWDHGALSRLIEQWDQVDPETQAVLHNGIPGLDLYVPSPVKNLRDAVSYSCEPLTDRINLCRSQEVLDDDNDLDLDEAADIIETPVVEAVLLAYPQFQELLSTDGPPTNILLHDLAGYADGTYMYGIALESTGGQCTMVIDVLLANAGAHSENSSVTVAGIPDGTPTESNSRTTAVHAVFHCFQHYTGVPPEPWLREGTAVWSEHHIYQTLNSEIFYMGPWVARPITAFLARDYDVSYPFIHADVTGGGAGPVIAVLQSASIDQLHSNFPDTWHQVSVTSWNQDPVTPLVDNGATVPETVADWGIMPINEDAEETMEFSLPPWSRDVQTFEFIGGTTEEELVRFARLKLDLAGVPPEVKISALAETADGWEAPELLSGTERVFCRKAVGPCNDEPVDPKPYTRIVLIATNTAETEQSFTLPWDTYNPHLHGSWNRIDGPISQVPGNAAPYAIVGTSLTFDEPEFVMGENVNAHTIITYEGGWDCTFGGSGSVTADPTYGPVNSTSAMGTVGIAGAISGVTFTNDCVFTASNGKETEVSGLNVPVNAAAGPSGAFGFEIISSDTLIITGFAVAYIYERTSHLP